MAPQDSFIDDEEDTCPLCIEEFDLADRNFRPCPCGYQICQFCYNNLKNNLNGLCPACRRPYDEKDIKWKVVTREEEAEFRANIQKNQKKRATEQRQKEVQKREAEKESRKNLQGVRVVQKNLVYVTGLIPTVREDELLKTLRQKEFFGQYGNIQKISISNRKSADGHPQSIGIYVTFEKKDDAARCIQAVHGSQNGDRTLKAQLGTTKYCSAWLRHEQCGNRQCMFLHELGDEEDSYSRQDLSSLNSVHTQRPLASSSSRSASRQQTTSIGSSQPMVRTSSKEGSDAGDGPALPASANWARTTQQRSRRGSHATSGAASSPAISTSLPVTTESPQEPIETAAPTEASASADRKAEKQPAVDAPAKVAAPNAKTTSGFLQDMLDFSGIMKLISDIPESAFVPPTNKDTDDSFPPLFDVNGWRRRRAMRDEDENRLGEPEEQVDNLEPSEGEPESGSLALGGEPEDRDQGRESARYDQRRNLAQPPIQRTIANDVFGPSLSGYGQGSSAVGSIGGRTLTPQQQVFMRPQGSFADQMPPGISAQSSSLFQGQGGHSRQQSRFSFANENNSSSINVKTTGDPRYMAQQSSMMPSGYRPQPGNQLYSSSIPGPPPGLKSTGSTPVNGGMFGQNHSFGGSAFGAASKDNSSELLQSIIRGRGAGSTQAHDASKREYFSFNNQYPPSTSSTPAPAPAPGLLASLHGTQPGAFQDFGPKQKKKGKKHRHANTSSSGGSGLVDLADPSILQARMQHQQQQGSTGVGQGLYGGQNQDDDFLPLDEVSSSVDALVADDDDEIEEPGLLYSLDSGRTSVPPGLGLSYSHPAQLTESSTPVPQTQTGQSVIFSKPLPIQRPVTPLIPKAAANLAPSAKKESTSASGNEAKKSIKELAARSGLSKDIAAQASKTASGKGVLQEEDFPALDSVKTSSPPKLTPVLPSRSASSAKASQAKKTISDTIAKSSVNKAAPNKSEKRPVPGILDIAAATKTIAQTGVGIGEAASGTDKSSSQIPTSATQIRRASTLATPTPTTASVSSPLAKVAPKTLRLVHTPKTETPSIHIPPAAVASIRAAGMASSSHRPATPASEIISDTASIVSASVSVSRTSSPPPSKVGTASVRATTKSQQRKQRKEASKEAAAQIAESKPVEQEVEIAPILGRKKKQKKEKRANAASRPETPSIAETPVDTSAPQKGAFTPPADMSEKPNKGIKNTAAAAELPKVADQKSRAVKSPPRSPVAVDTSIRLNESTKTTVLTPDYVGHTPDLKQEQRTDEDVGDIPNLRDVFRLLVESGSLPDAEAVSFFKAIQGYRSDFIGNMPTTLPPTLKAIVTKEDEDKLNAFQPVRKIVNEHTVLLTPNGDCLLNLTESEAELFLELQDRLRADSLRPTAFAAPRHSPSTGFSLMKNRAVPNGTPSYFPAGPDNYPSDPVGKMHREEAISCINQHVLPSLNLSGYKNAGSGANAGRNLNLQQLAPWIYPPTDGAGDPGKMMFSGRAGDEFGQAAAAVGNGGLPFNVPPFDSYNDGSIGGSGSGTAGEQQPSPSIGSRPLMSVEDAEAALTQAKKQHDALDKKLRQLQTKNRRLVGLH